MCFTMWQYFLETLPALYSLLIVTLVLDNSFCKGWGISEYNFFELDSSSNNSMSQITRQTEMDEIPHSSAKVASSVQNCQVHFSSVTLNYFAYHRSLNELFKEDDHKSKIKSRLAIRPSQESCQESLLGMKQLPNGVCLVAMNFYTRINFPFVTWPLQSLTIS